MPFHEDISIKLNLNKTMNDKDILKIFNEGLMNVIFYDSTLIINLIDRLIPYCDNKIEYEDDNQLILDVINVPYSKTKFHRQYQFKLGKSHKVSPIGVDKYYKKIIDIVQLF